MKKLGHVLQLMILAISFVGLVSCANIVRPGGGEKDVQGPIAHRADPKHQSLHFESNKIVLEFDEFLKPGSYGEEVFVSPVLGMPPDVLVSGKKLIIRFGEDLKPNTTYVVSVGTNILDFTEGNPMTEPIVYAFSTGEQLDTLNFKGMLNDDMGTVDLKGMTMLLFEADSIEGNNIKDKRPCYASMVEDGGMFSFQYLKPGRYKLYGVRDIDKSYTWNQSKEAVAMGNMIELLIDSTQKPPEVRLNAFLQDEDWPRVKSAKWIDDENIFVEFKETIRRGFGPDSLIITMSDTLGGPELPITQWDFSSTSTQSLFLHAKRPQDSTSRIHFHHLIDSLGNKGDTFEVVTPASKIKGADPRLFADPVTVAHERTVYIQSQHPIQLPLPDSLVFVTDTNGNEIKTKVEASPYLIKVRFGEWPVTKVPTSLHLKPGIAFLDTVLDTVLSWKLAIPKHDDFGSLSGTVVREAKDSLLNLRWILILYAEGGKGPVAVRRTNGEMKFSFDYLKPGIYTIKLVNDVDGNGYFTPGSLALGRQPERVVVLTDRIEIKAKWDIEDFKASTTYIPKTTALKSTAENKDPEGTKPNNKSSKKPGGKGMKK